MTPEEQRAIIDRAMELYGEPPQPAPEPAPVAAETPSPSFDVSQMPEAVQRRVSRVADAGYAPLAVLQNGGVVYQRPDGEFGIVNEVGSRRLSEDEAQSIMAGSDTYGSVAQSDFYNEVIRQHPVAARASKFVQGGLGFGEYVDEGIGAVMGEDARVGTRLLQRAMDEERPGESLAWRVAGGVTSAAPLASLTGGRAFLGRRPALTRALGGSVGLGVGGGIEGGFSGYGRGTTPEERRQFARDDAAIGAAVGVTLGITAPLARRIVDYGISKLKGSAVADIARAFGISDEAARVLKKKSLADDFDDQVQRLADAGDTAMLADANDAFQRTLRAAGASGDRALITGTKNAKNRLSIVTRRLNDELESAMGSPVGMTTRLKSLREGGAAARDVIYRKAYRFTLPTGTAPYRRLEELVTKVPDSVLTSANRRIKMDTTGTLPRQIRATITDAGDVVFDELPNTHQLQIIAQELEKLAKPGMESGVLGGQNALAREYKNLATEIRKNLKRINPAFRDASKVFADEAQIADATRFGAEILTRKLSMDDVLNEVADYTPAERAAAASGLRDYIDELFARVAPTQGNLADSDLMREAASQWKKLASREAREKLGALLGRNTANRIADRARAVGAAANIRNVVRAAGSQTNPLGQEVRSIRQTAGGDAADILDTVNPGSGFVARMLRKAVGKTPAALAEQDAAFFNEITSVLTEMRGPRAEGALRFLRQNANRALTEDEVGYLAALIGPAITGGGYQALTETRPGPLRLIGPQ